MKDAATQCFELDLGFCFEGGRAKGIFGHQIRQVVAGLGSKRVLFPGPLDLPRMAFYIFMGRRPHNYRAVKYIVLLDNSGTVQYRFELDSKGQLVYRNPPIIPQFANSVAPQRTIQIPISNTNVLLPPCLRDKHLTLTEADIPVMKQQ